MRKLLIGVLVMALPLLMLGQESKEAVLEQAGRDRAEIRKASGIIESWGIFNDWAKVQIMIDEILGQRNREELRKLEQLKSQPNRIVKQLWPPLLPQDEILDQMKLGQMKLDAQRILDNLKAELESEQSDMKWELNLQKEELRLERNRLLRELEDARFERRLIEEFLIYRPRYWREPYYFFIKGFPLPFEWRR